MEDGPLLPEPFEKGASIGDVEFCFEDFTIDFLKAEGGLLLKVELPQGEEVEWHFGWGLGGGMD